MKRKLFAAALVLALLTSAYTGYAYLSTRGLRIYLMGTRMGRILACSWQFALLAAIVFWIPGGVALVRKIAGPHRRRAAAAEGQGPTEILGEDTKTAPTLEPRKGGAGAAGPAKPQRGGKTTAPLFGRQKTAGPNSREVGEPEPTELLEPQKGGMEATELLEPQKDGMEPTELLEPQKGGMEVTELLEPREPDKSKGALLEPRRGAVPKRSDAAPAGEATELMEEALPEDVPEAEEPVPMPLPQGQVPQAQEGLALPARKETPRVCPNCGHPVTGKFCAQCGTKVDQ